MRVALVLALLGGFAVSQEGPAPEKNKPDLRDKGAPDPLGFPITFNDEILTKNDVLRTLGADAKVLGSSKVLRTERDRVLRMKLAEQVAADLGVEVTEEEVKLVVRRQIDEAGGDAKYYERLTQRGQTLAGQEADVAQRILVQKLSLLFQNGIFQRKLLPVRIRPTPREIKIAYDNDPARKSSGNRVKCTVHAVGLTKKERSKIAREAMFDDLSDEAIKERKAVIVDARLQTTMDAIRAGASPEELTKREGVVAKTDWVEVPKDKEAERVEDRFVQGAAVGDVSEPFERPDGYLIIKVLEREKPEARGPTNPEVAGKYDRMIRVLRGRKWEAEMNLRALDAATVRPEQVRQELRKDLVAELRQADEALRALGLH